VGAIEPLTGGTRADEEFDAGAASESWPVRRHDGSSVSPATAQVAEEVPIAFEYNGISHAVMLATPSDLHDFAVGFSCSEGIALPAQIYGVEVRESAAGITLAIEIAASAFSRLRERRRTLAGRTGCGICGTESLEQVLHALPDLSALPVSVDPAALARAHAGLIDVQPLQHATGAAHGAVWCTSDGSILVAREDVGRHNALDKLIGALVRNGLDTGTGFALVTSRASVERVPPPAWRSLPPCRPRPHLRFVPPSAAVRR